MIWILVICLGDPTSPDPKIAQCDVPVITLTEAECKIEADKYNVDPKKYCQRIL